MAKDFWDEKDFLSPNYQSEDDGQLTIWFDSNEPPDPDDYDNLDDFDQAWDVWECDQTCELGDTMPPNFNPTGLPYSPDNQRLLDIKAIIDSIECPLIRKAFSIGFMLCLRSTIEAEFNLTNELGSRLGSRLGDTIDPNPPDPPDKGKDRDAANPPIFSVPNDLHAQCLALGLPLSYADKAIKLAGGKGIIEIKQFKGNDYAYLRYRLNGHKRSRYLGVVK